MKKKFGFTLAEVLITLTVIGIVSALAAPVLVGSFNKSKVGPSLRKFINTIENANEHILGDTGTERLNEFTSDTQTYLEKLNQFVKGSIEKDDSDNVLTLDNVSIKPTNYAGSNYNFKLGNTNYIIYDFNNGDSAAVKVYSSDELSSAEDQNSSGSYKGGYALIAYDINGFNTKPNKLAKDIFLFTVDNNGSVVPYGGKTYASAYSVGTSTTPLWDGGSSICNESEVAVGNSCAGSVADNGWKVIYKY